jgi:hypothetical protein
MNSAATTLLRTARSLLARNQMNSGTVTLRWRVPAAAGTDLQIERDGAVTESSAAIRAFIHYVTPGATGFQRFQEVATGDVILDLPPEVDLSGKEDLRFEIAELSYVQKEIGRELAAAWDTRLGDQKVLRTVLLRPAGPAASTAATFLLDTFTANGGYALRVLSSAFATSPVILAQRASDAAEQGFLADEITDGTLAEWSGGGDVYVSELADQSGNGMDLQALKSNMPKIVVAGTLVTDGGLPALLGNGYLCTLATKPQDPIDLSLFSVACVFRDRQNTGSYEGAAWAFGPTLEHAIRYASLATSRLTQPTLTTGDGTSNESATVDMERDAQVLVTAIRNGAAAGAWVNGASVLAENSRTLSTSTDRFMVMGRYYGTTPRSLAGLWQEAVWWDTDIATDRSAIEAEVMAAYGL